MKTQGIKNKTTKNNKKDIEEKRLEELKAVSVYMEQKLHIQIKTIKTELELKSDNQAIIYLLGKGIQSFYENKNEITDEFMEIKSQLNKIINQNEKTLKGINAFKAMMVNGLSYGFGRVISLSWRLYTNSNPNEKQKEDTKRWRDFFSKETITAISKREKSDEENI